MFAPHLDLAGTPALFSETMMPAPSITVPRQPCTPTASPSAIVSVVSRGDLVEELFASARGGRPQAWAELYALMRPRLFRYARLRLATDEQAEDAVSETMTRAIASADRYREGAGPAAWLVGICRNVVFETYRAGGRTRPVDPERLLRTSSPTPEPGPAERVVARSEEEQMRAAFERLSPEDQDVLSLRVVAGLDAEEVATTLGKRPGAVRMAQSRALSRLRGHMGEAP